MDEYEDRKEYSKEEYDEFLELCKRIPVGELLSPTDVLEYINEQVGEEIEDEIDLIGEDVFYKQIEEFLKKQTHYYIYQQTGKKILLERKRDFYKNS